MSLIYNDADIREKFLFTLEWLLSVMARQTSPEPQFCLARLSFGSYESMGDAFGAPEAVEHLIEVAASLRESFRKTDLIARDGVDLWILTPYMPTTEKIKQKFMLIEETAARLGLDIVDRSIEVFLLPNPETVIMNQGTAIDLLNHLKGEHERLAMMKITLPHKQ